MSEQALQRFASIFSGRTDAWGALHGQAVKEPVTLEHHRRHLQGRVSLGIYPLLLNGRIRWLAIDMTDDGDLTGVEHQGNYSATGVRELLKKVAAAGLDPEECHLRLVELLREIREQADAVEDTASGADLTNAGSDTRRSQASQIVDLALEKGAVLFHDDREEPYAVLPLARREIWPVGTKAVRRWPVGVERRS